MKVLANDGISNSGIKALEKGGFEVITTKVAQEQVASFLNTHSIDVLLVRSATKVRQDIIDNWLETVKNGTILPERELRILCEKVKEILIEESNVQPVKAPVTICGDIHG